MPSIVLLSPQDVCRSLAARAKAARLAENLTQEALAERAGITLAAVRRFEQKGAASLEGFVRITLALRLEDGFEALVRPREFRTLDDVVASGRTRQRARSK